MNQSVGVGGHAVWIRLTSAVCLLVGLLLLVPTVYYAWLDIDPPPTGPGDLYFGDGTGFVIAAMFGVPAVAALTSGGLLIAWSRRRSVTYALTMS